MHKSINDIGVVQKLKVPDILKTGIIRILRNAKSIWETIKKLNKSKSSLRIKQWRQKIKFIASSLRPRILINKNNKTEEDKNRIFFKFQPRKFKKSDQFKWQSFGGRSDRLDL